jgi:hypothetical protein
VHSRKIKHGKPDVILHSEHLNCMGRHTLSGLITASGHQFMDWSSAYRLFSRNRIDVSRFFDVARTSVLEELYHQDSIVAHMDDTILKKTGIKIPWYSMAQGSTWSSVPDKFYLGTTIFTNINGSSGSTRMFAIQSYSG